MRSMEAFKEKRSGRLFFGLPSVPVLFLTTNGMVRKIVVKKARVYHIMKKWLAMDLMYA